MKKIIPTHWHTFIDYMTALILLVTPWIADFEEARAASMVGWIVGGLIVVQALMTKYEGGLIRVIPISAHLFMDVLLGAFLILSPFLFRFPPDVHVLHTFLGFVVLGSGLFTEHKIRKYTTPVRR